MLKARVHPADEHDAEGAKPLLVALKDALPRLELIWVDGGYKRRFAEWVATELGWRVETVQHPEAGLRWVWVGPLPGVAPALGGGAHLRLAGPQPPPQQGLRGPAGDRRGLDLRGLEPPPPAAARPMTPFHTGSQSRKWWRYEARLRTRSRSIFV